MSDRDPQHCGYLSHTLRLHLIDFQLNTYFIFPLLHVLPQLTQRYSKISFILSDLPYSMYCRILVLQTRFHRILKYVRSVRLFSEKPVNEEKAKAKTNKTKQNKKQTNHLTLIWQANLLLIMHRARIITQAYSYIHGAALWNSS